MQGQTVATLQALFGEMASLFPDAVFHIGSDETSALGPCTTQRWVLDTGSRLCMPHLYLLPCSTFALERSVLDYVQANLSKTPAGWEEVRFLWRAHQLFRFVSCVFVPIFASMQVLFDAGAATPQTVVYSWSHHNPYEVTATGHKVRSAVHVPIILKSIFYC